MHTFSSSTVFLWLHKSRHDLKMKKELSVTNKYYLSYFLLLFVGIEHNTTIAINRPLLLKLSLLELSIAAFNCDFNKYLCAAQYLYISCTKFHKQNVGLNKMIY